MVLVHWQANILISRQLLLWRLPRVLGDPLHPSNRPDPARSLEGVTVIAQPAEADSSGVQERAV